MNMTRVKRILASASVEQLVELSAYLRERKHELLERVRQKALHDAFERVKDVKPGDVLFAHNKQQDHVIAWAKVGAKLVSPLRRSATLFGDPLRVYRVQPKAERVWLLWRRGMLVLALEPKELHAFDIRKEVPVDAVTQAILGKEKDEEIPW